MRFHVRLAVGDDFVVRRPLHGLAGLVFEVFDEAFHLLARLIFERIKLLRLLPLVEGCQHGLQYCFQLLLDLAAAHREQALLIVLRRDF